jgi:hypothetical protein
MFLRTVIIFTALLFCGCGYNPGDRLLGAWEGREKDGSRMLMVFEKAGRLTVVAGSERGSGTYVIHPKTSPVQIDLDFTLGTTPISAKSIFVFLSANQLKLAQPAQERPADFEGKVLLLTRHTP